MVADDYIAKTRAVLGEQTFTAEFEKGRAALAVRKPEIPFNTTEPNEIIIESHKFERIVIEEEVENVNQERKLLSAHSLNQTKIPTRRRG